MSRPISLAIALLILLGVAFGATKLQQTKESQPPVVMEILEEKQGIKVPGSLVGELLAKDSGLKMEVYAPEKLGLWPVSLEFAPDPDNRLFIAELHTGRVSTIKDGGQPEEWFTFPDIPTRCNFEAGVVGIAFDPEYSQNGHAYFFVTKADPEGKSDINQVWRVTNGENGKGTSPHVVLTNIPAHTRHNGGHLHFRRDANIWNLYIAVGNNKGEIEPEKEPEGCPKDIDQPDLAQDLSSPLGKILRLGPQVYRGTATVNTPANFIFASGLRNTWDFAFHPVTGQLFGMENGPENNEELNIITQGGNYGWPPSGFQDRPGITEPVAVWPIRLGPAGVTFYSSDAISSWQNDFFWCNWNKSELRRLRLGANGRPEFEEIIAKGCRLAVTQGPDGGLYFSTLRWEGQNQWSEILRIVPR